MLAGQPRGKSSAESWARVWASSGVARRMVGVVGMVGLGWDETPFYGRAGKIAEEKG